MEHHERTYTTDVYHLFVSINVALFNNKWNLLYEVREEEIYSTIISRVIRFKKINLLYDYL